MNIKEALELEDEGLADEEIMQKIAEAVQNNQTTITLQSKSGPITINLPNLNSNFSKHIDPWDGKLGN